MEFDENLTNLSYKHLEREYIDDIIREKDRLISLQERDMDSLKREIEELKKELNYSRRKKK